jgi:hypothetical protein
MIFLVEYVRDVRPRPYVCFSLSNVQENHGQTVRNVFIQRPPHILDSSSLSGSDRMHRGDRYFLHSTLFLIFMLIILGIHALTKLNLCLKLD